MADELKPVLDAIAELKRHTDARFDQVDVRFEAVDARFDEVNARFEAVDARFDQVDVRFDQVDVRFDEVKRHSDVRFDEVHHRIDQSREATALLAAKVDRQAGELREEMRAGFDEVKAAVRFSYAELDRRLTSTEHDLADLRSRVERLETGPGDAISDR